jgi:hypothetical protein
MRQKGSDVALEILNIHAWPEDHSEIGHAGTPWVHPSLECGAIWPSPCQFDQNEWLEEHHWRPWGESSATEVLLEVVVQEGQCWRMHYNKSKQMWLGFMTIWGINEQCWLELLLVKNDKSLRTMWLRSKKTIFVPNGMFLMPFWHLSWDPFSHFR